MRGILLVKNNERHNDIPLLLKKQQEDYEQWALPSYVLAPNHNIANGLAPADVYFTLKLGYNLPNFSWYIGAPPVLWWPTPCCLAMTGGLH